MGALRDYPYRVKGIATMVAGFFLMVVAKAADACDARGLLLIAGVCVLGVGVGWLGTPERWER